ncbi:MAG TPA: VOC family protein [Longimicrobiales bacterium]
MTLTTKGFHHIALVTADAARAERFYSDVLGVSLLRRRSAREDSAYALHFGNAAGEPGTVLTFLEQRGSARGRPGAGGVHHYALMVDTPEAQLKWKRRLADHGVHVAGPYNRGWFRSIYFADPDGQIVEIATRGPGYTFDEPATALGGQIVVPPTAELRGRRDEAEVRARVHADAVPVITPDMQLDGLHHISGLTDDVARIGEFYEAALGLRLVKRSVNQDDPSMPHWFWANYDGREVAPRSSLTMFGGWADGGARLVGTLKRAVAGAGQAHHIAFRAADEHELHGWMDHLRSMGIETSGVLDRRWFRSIEFRAPDGMLMEIATDGPGYSAAEREAA